MFYGNLGLLKYTKIATSQQGSMSPVSPPEPLYSVHRELFKESYNSCPCEFAAAIPSRTGVYIQIHTFISKLARNDLAATRRYDGLAARNDLPRLQTSGLQVRSRRRSGLTLIKEESEESLGFGVAAQKLLAARR